MILDRLLSLLLVALALVTAASLLGEHNWLLELFSHFRIQYLAGGLLLLGCFVLRGRRLAALATLAFLVPSALLVAPYLIPGGARAIAAAESSDPLALMTLNLGFRNSRYDDVRQIIAARSPDIVVLAEFTEAWEAALAPIRSQYRWQAGESREGPFGLTVMSRFPLEDIEVTDLGVAGTVHVLATIRRPEGSVVLAAVHLVPPITGEQAIVQRGQLATLAEHILQRVDAGAGIVAGDLNLTPWSSGFRQLKDATGFRDAAVDVGLRFTWPARYWPLALAIDHCLVSDSITTESYSAGPDVGSDHLPVTCVLNLASNSIDTGPV